MSDMSIMMSAILVAVAVNIGLYHASERIAKAIEGLANVLDNLDAAVRRSLP